jgi:hypothetical protein
VGSNAEIHHSHYALQSDPSVVQLDGIAIFLIGVGHMFLFL